MLNNNEINGSNKEKLLGILLDSKRNFESRIGPFLRKADQKIIALARLKNFLIQIKETYSGPQKWKTFCGATNYEILSASMVGRQEIFSFQVV